MKTLVIILLGLFPLVLLVDVGFIVLDIWGIIPHQFVRKVGYTLFLLTVVTFVIGHITYGNLD